MSSPLRGPAAGTERVIGAGVVNIRLCGDISGNLSIGTEDVDQARRFLVGRTIAGDIALCNVVGPFDPVGTGADCTVLDVFTLSRFAAGAIVPIVNNCKP